MDRRVRCGSGIGCRCAAAGGEDELQVEALAATAAWAARYDCGAWDDPPGKLALHHELERVGQLASGRSRSLPTGTAPAFQRDVTDRRRAAGTDRRKREQA